MGIIDMDHIFLAPGTRVTSHETFGDFYGDNFYPSGHFPMKVVIDFRNGDSR